jgi:hypothetical protein
MKVQKEAKMGECRKKGLCYYYDENYSSGLKIQEQKFFQIDALASTSYEDIPSNEVPEQ